MKTKTIVAMAGVLLGVVLIAGAIVHKKSGKAGFNVPQTYKAQYNMYNGLGSASTTVIIYKSGDAFREEYFESENAEPFNIKIKVGTTYTVCYSIPHKECVISSGSQYYPPRSEFFPKKGGIASAGTVTLLPQKMILGFKARCYRDTKGSKDENGDSMIVTDYCLHPEYDILLEYFDLNAQTFNIESVPDKIFAFPKDYKIVEEFSEE